MTREEANEKLLDLMHSEEVGEHGLELIDKIYDDIESRTCENCKHMGQEGCTLIGDWDGYNDEPCEWSPPSDFGCNKWEQK